MAKITDFKAHSAKIKAKIAGVAHEVAEAPVQHVHVPEIPEVPVEETHVEAQPEVHSEPENQI